MNKWQFLAVGALAACGASAQPDASDLLELSIEELANLRITSASRIAENLRDTPASVFVITADEIRRSGVTSIPEALRLAPGVEVARRSAYEWSISIRGFNSDLSNKLLVLIDGRSVYSPLYAGVFWDAQDTLLEDIERIEVISGPGGTLWGANAVNGVINIITRQAQDTRGGYGELLGGDEEQLIAGFRYGGTIGERVAARGYVKYLERDSTMASTGDDAVDAMRMSRAGFRLDWGGAEPDRFTVTGDVFQGETDGLFLDDFTIGTLPAGTFRDVVDISGANLLGRWERALGQGSDLQLQFYYDHTERDIPNTLDERRDTFDLDFQHHLPLGERQDFLWGLTYRESSDSIRNSLFASFEPPSRTTRRYGAFFQDRIALLPDRLYLTVGSKLGRNDFTGTEHQPSVRLAWRPDRRQTLWTAISRSIRIPSRLDDDLVLTIPAGAPGIPIPFYFVVTGSDDFQSEELIAYEAGYRFQQGENLSFDLALFHNEYDRLQTNEPDPPIIVLDPLLPHVIVPSHLANNMQGESIGGTFVANWQPLARWRLRFQYAYLGLDLVTVAPSQDVDRTVIAGNSPRHQAAIYSFLDLPQDFSFYAGVRFVDELPNQGVDAYAATDINLAWRFRPNVVVALAVQNLTDDTHPEFEAGIGNLIERSAYLKLDWSF
ncbi:MAG: TonB-dependent receptor plug domain-containing protein [Steroidobacteraceae bacterium]